jgi:hypothetical protein
MAKQTYTSGQVLSAAQMTTLQANDYNQTVSAKVASYTLVAADAGTRITMSNAGATTITVNTGLFAAGDTLYITNIGAGTSTITAGTATVSTISSLALAQYDSGVLYFTSTGVAIWQKYDGAAAGAGGSMTLISTTSLTGATVTLSSIPQTYKNLRLVFKDFYHTGGSGSYASLGYTINAVTGAYDYFQANQSGQNTALTGTFARIASDVNGIDANNLVITDFYEYANTATHKYSYSQCVVGDGGGNYNVWNMRSGIRTTAAITSITLSFTANNFATAGTLELYGVN